MSKTTVRFSDEDLKDLERCQQVLGQVSQSDAIRIIMRMFLGKIPSFQAGEKGKR